MRKIFGPLLIAVGAVAAFSFGALFDRYALWRPDRAATTPATTRPDFALIREAWDTIDREYVDRPALKPAALTQGAIAGMVDALGDTGHSGFLAPAMVKDERALLRGDYVGVGLEIESRNDAVQIVAPLDNSPALAAGLRAGEQIVNVDGESVAGMDLAHVVERVEGPAGTTVTLRISDPSTHRSFDVTLRRTRIHLAFVSWSAVPGTSIADLRIAAFNPGTDRAVKDALRQIEAQGLHGAILDMRNDPGGVLNEAIAVASELLRGGDVLLEKDSHGSIEHDAVRGGGTAVDLPVVVLINRGTASAAEIVAGALQDARRATLVGATTFGTGTVLSDFPLSDGSVVRLAVSEWLTPKGRSIWHTGIVPDLAVTMPPDAETLTPTSLKGMSRGAFNAASDPQLKKALEVVENEKNKGTAAR